VNNWWDYYGDPANKLHADFPGMECLMVGAQETFFLDSDGGTYRSTNGVTTVQNLSLEGLGISQYYDIFTSSTDPYLVAAGAQDQGYQQSLPATAPYLAFEQLISGDYGHLTSTTGTHDLLYSVYPGFVLVQLNEAPPQGLLQLDFPAGASYSWMPNILADPSDPEVFYLCADHLWKYDRTGASSWSSAQLPQSFATSGASFATSLAIATADTDYWYVATNNGRLWTSHDAGASWTMSSTGPPAHYFYGTDILVSPSDPNVAYVAGAGYSNPAVFRTTDGGVSWQAMADGLPSTLVFMLAFDNDVDQTLFAAAEAGPYKYDSTLGRWLSLLGTEAPLTTYWCVESVPELDVVRFGTYGRGIWDFAADGVVAVGEPGAPAARPAGLEVLPNPASRSVRFAFDVAREGPVRVDVFDIGGRRLARPVDELLRAGSHEAWYDLTTDADRPLENGVYLVRVSTSTSVRVGKLRVAR
jgi:hypothetical protein